MAEGQFLQRLGLRCPIIQAPMGGFTTPALVAAVSNAGALGSVGAPYFSPEQIAVEAARIRALTDRPFNINVFAGGYATENAVDPGPMLRLLGDIHDELGLAPPVLPPLGKFPLLDQIEAVIAARPAVFSFAFGIPPAEALARLRAAGCLIVGTATTLVEAKALAAAKVDAIVAQGAEAGAHRGTFIGAFEAAMVPTVTLVEQIVATVPLPVIAAGGLMNGADIAAVLKRGAVAAQLGTAFMCCPEAGTAAAHKQALLDARSDTTAVTRAYSGRPARGLVTEFMRRVDPRPEIILPFPLQNDLTRPMRNAATKAGDRRFLSLWAGQGVARIRAMPAAALVARLAEELVAAP
jgi:nitronate monooxygenase